MFFAHPEQLLNPMLGSSFIANFMLTEIGPRGVVFRHFAEDERFARRSRNEPSPEILLTLPFSGIFQGFFRALLLLKPLSRSRSVAGVHVCVRVWLCIVYVVCWVCAISLEKYEEMNKY